MYPHDSIECPLSASDHVDDQPASLNFNRYYHQPSRFMAEDSATQRRMLAYYVAGFPGWSSREVDAWWRWFNRVQVVGGSGGVHRRPLGGK